MDDRSWANSVLSKLDAKMTYGVQKAQTLDGIPYTVQGSEWKSNGIGWWTNGFWPAEMWQMYLATGKELYRAEALRAETLMDEALKNFTSLHHDVGFLWLINSGVHYALDGNADSLYHREINAQLAEFAALRPEYALVRARDLPDRGDRLHFSAHAQRRLGIRYACAWMDTVAALSPREEICAPVKAEYV